MIRYLSGSLFLTFFANFLFAQSNSLDRKYEPIVVSAGELSGFTGSDYEGAPVSQLFAFAYDGSSQSWRMIPFQADERDASGSYFLTDEVAGLDENDELAFMASDAGDFPGGWINDADSEQYNRLQIEITDPLAPQKKGWVYIYRSATLTNQFEPYIHYIPPPEGSPADTVMGVTYKIGAGGDGVDESSGFFDFLSFTDVSDEDILDRQKIRVGVNLGFPIVLNEQAFAFVKIDKVVGGVRILKELTLNLLDNDVPFPFKFYAYSAELGGTFSIPEDQSPPIQSISQSFDFTPAATGMKFFSNYNLDGITIDGSMSPDSTMLSTKLDTLPGVNWFQFSGVQGTLVNLLEISAIGDKRFLSYKDDSTVDDDDTGDKMRFGDTGIGVTDSSIVGDFPLGLKAFLLNPNEPSDLGAQLAEFEQNPLTIVSEMQDFQAVSVASNPELVPEVFELSQNFPNPFNPETIIKYRLPGPGLGSVTTKLKIYDLLGREVITLIDGKQPSGFYQVKWNGRDKSGHQVGSGVYIYQLKSGQFQATKKMLLVR